MLCRCTKTSIFSNGTPNRCFASITSSPLFISVALSTVIFAPMLQLGWRRASFAVIWVSSSFVFPKNGPPEAVSKIRFTSLSKLSRFTRAARHWKTALCSESTGMISAPVCPARSITISPAVTNVSLLARPMRFFASTAARVGARPAMPTMPVITVSASG